VRVRCKMREIPCPISAPSDATACLLRPEDEDYVFGCAAENWDVPDAFRMCRLVDGRVDWLVDTRNTNTLNMVDMILRVAGPQMHGRVMISGAHFIPNLRDRYYCGEGPLKTLQLSMMVMETLQALDHPVVDFLMLVDDLYMMHDYVRLDRSSYNHYRKELFDEIVVPTRIAETLNDRLANGLRPFRVYYSTEKCLADRFNRHVKTRKRHEPVFISGEEIPEYGSGDWFVRVAGGDLVQVIGDHKPNCPAAVADLVREVEVSVDNRRTESNYQTLLAFFPSCSMQNVLDGLKVASAVYSTDLVTYVVFTTTRCF
jgi:hypothetical protein